MDGFSAAQDYVANTQAHSAEPLHAAINWNYLPASGGSILHPHLRATLSATETNYRRELRERGAAFRERTGQGYLSAFCAVEEEGGVRWLHAFAPTSDNDVIGVLPAPHSNPRGSTQHGSICAASAEARGSPRRCTTSVTARH